jgi:hypothetical protein
MLCGHPEKARVRASTVARARRGARLEDSQMKRINQDYFYKLGLTVHPLLLIEQDANLQAIMWDLNNARMWLKWILQNDLFTLIVSRTAAQSIVTAIDSVLPAEVVEFASIAPDRKLTWMEAYLIRKGVEEFETVFSHELPTLDTYIVSKKGIYSTVDLIERAEMAIDESARKGVSSAALSDFQQAGRCLAIELPTGAGFHTMRAVEAVLRAYWTLATKPADGSRPPEMAQCINELRAAGEDAKLMDVLDHIRDLHRNTIMHPEAFLNMKEALRLFDIAKSALSAMGDRVVALRAPASTSLGLSLGASIAALANAGVTS